MIHLRHEQLEALTRPQRDAMTDRLVILLRRHWRQRCAAFDQAALLEWVERGLQRASGYGIVSETDLACFLNLMMALGPEFDRDPAYPWAKALLEDDAIAPRHTMKRLEELARQWLSRQPGAGTGRPR